MNKIQKVFITKILNIWYMAYIYEDGILGYVACSSYWEARNFYQRWKPTLMDPSWAGKAGDHNYWRLINSSTINRLKEHLDKQQRMMLE